MRPVRSIALAVGVLVTMASCSSTEPAEMTLDEATVAFYLSAETFESNGAAEKLPGYLVLAKADGGSRMIETKGMNEAHIAWAENELFFSDEERDYLLGKNGLVSFENRKSGLQQSAFALPDGKGFVAIYNDGMSGDGYSNQVAVTTSTGSRLYQVEGNYYMNASCGGALYGIATQSGRHFPASAQVPGMRSKADPAAEPELLSRLYPPAEGREKTIAWRAAFDAADHNRHVPCHDGVITFLSDYADGDGTPHLTVVRWDTRTGEYREQPLVDAQGRPIGEELVKPEEFSAKSYDARAIRGGRLEWLSADGRIMSTEIASGVTKPRFDTGFVTGDGSAGQVAFTDRSIHVIHEVFDGKTPVKIKRFDRISGDLVAETTVPGTTDRLGLKYNLRGMAVPPSA
ncbi:hypothetical protein DMC64_02620 [Amycolatopsis sp. WAC 04197]|uniref:hypothetical protein n=1 Tax=Amycolatopsis sp. WAC 04197 TaxID=2203199 RepID=UPI000F79585F|nr:hypothetical protein [Amycolatopsis sp. WAC 04197]RSN49475.1 hypothetical protein DMC64_02620 [Amycolatopsis sp. WAC 04197]